MIEKPMQLAIGPKWKAARLDLTKSGRLHCVVSWAWQPTQYSTLVLRNASTLYLTLQRQFYSRSGCRKITHLDRSASHFARNVRFVSARAELASHVCGRSEQIA